MCRVLLALATLMVGPVAAQSLIRGQVADETGAVVPKAKVTIVGQNGEQAAIADDRGFYVITGVAPGDYDISASAPQLSTPQSIRIALGTSPLTVNLLVKVVATAQRITVRDDTRSAVSTDPAN